VLLAGAFQGECVSDMQAAFEALELDFEAIGELIVGSGVQYCWKNKSPEEIECYLENFILSIEQTLNQLYEELNVDSLEELASPKPEYVRNLEESLNDAFLKNIDYFKYLDISAPYSSFDEINEIIEHIINEEDESCTYYLKTEEPLKKLFFTKIEKNLIQKTYYHGSFWSVNEDNKFINLKTNESDLNVVYISNALETAEWFSKYKLTDEKEEIPIVMEINKNFEKTFEWKDGDDRNIIINGEEIDLIVDREKFFNVLKNDYDAVVIKNNYVNLGNGDDIACLDDIASNDVKKVKLFLNNKWTDFMDPDDAIKKVDSLIKNNKKTKLKYK